MKFHYDGNGQAGTGQFWQMESALVLFLIPRRSFQQWRWIFISWSLSNLEKKKHGRLYLEHMTNGLNLITMTTNLVISFACNGRRREMCVGGGKREGTGKRGKAFFYPLLTFLLFASDFLQLTVVLLILQQQLYFKLFIASSRLQMKTKQLLIT